jgi:glycosyltransferase involved in cell wall biosynthesis
MNNQTIPQPIILPRNPKLSVCMIVRDEEKTLPRCLKSVQDVADELIVVDTGSKDNTISIAKDFGAKVFHFKWNDDFAAARNESLKHATGDWILQIDADEELLSGSIPHLKDRMLESKVLCYFILCDNGPMSLGPQFNWVSRLFRRHPKIRYRRPYHERVDGSVENLVAAESGWQVLHDRDIIICHYGYEPSEFQRKCERGLRIMESYLKENPYDAFILTKLGGIYCDIGHYDKAEAYLNRAMHINPNSSEINFCLGLTLQRQKKLEAAIRCFRKCIDTDPFGADAYYILGEIYMQKGNNEEAIKYVDKAVELGVPIHPHLLELLKPYR